MSTAPVPDEFNLREILHSAVETTVKPDSHAVADTAFEAIDPADYPEALRQALHMYMPNFIASTRMTRRSRRATPPTPTGKTSGASKPVPRSRLVDATRKRFLGTRENSPHHGGAIFLRDCTVEDLESIAEYRYSLAEQNQAKGDWWRRCAKEVAAHGVRTFGELPDDTIDELMEVGL